MRMKMATPTKKIMHSKMHSTKKGNARVGKPAGSRLAYDDVRRKKSNWAHKVLA